MFKAAKNTELTTNGDTGSFETAATDMSPAYALAVRNHLPNAVHVYDRFHVVKLFNEKLSQLRRELYNEAVGPLRKKVLKGTRWLLLRSRDTITCAADRLRLREPLDATVRSSRSTCSRTT